MHDPDSYDKYSEFQRRDALELIPYLASSMKQRRSEIVLDFGCGSGDNTVNILLPCLRGDGNGENRPAIKIYGVDISKKMIQFASCKYKNPDVTYMVADVSKDNCEFPCRFDKIFSFHVLHWVSDQKKTLRALWRLLKSNGEIGLYFIANAAVFAVYEAMSKMDAWKPYLKDVKNFIPKSYFSSDPAYDMKLLMSSIGFQVQEAKNCTRQFVFENLDEMIESAMAANPFVHRIPSEQLAAYKRDFRYSFLPFVKEQSNRCIEVDYEIVLIRAKKP